MTYPAFSKIPRLHRDVVITEMIDGTNAQVFIQPRDDTPLASWEIPVGANDGENYKLSAGSRTRWITPDDDNHGFARWVWQNADELVELGPGHHYGEWWGLGINRGYGLQEKRFSLFNTSRWSDLNARPACCDVVPILTSGGGEKLTHLVANAIYNLETMGSFAAPGYDRPEGIVIYHTAANVLFKVTLEKDAVRKTEVEPRQKSGMDSPVFADSYPIGTAKFVTELGEPVLVAA